MKIVSWLIIQLYMINLLSKILKSSFLLHSKRNKSKALLIRVNNVKDKGNHQFILSIKKIYHSFPIQ